MSVWLWVLVGVIGLVLLAVLWAIIQDRLEIRRLMKDPDFMQGIDTMVARAQARPEIAELVRANNISGLLRAFSLADGWETRERVMVALGNVCRDAKVGTDYERSEMVSTLRSIIELCKAETSGGSYRENCIDHAQMLLKRFE